MVRKYLFMLSVGFLLMITCNEVFAFDMIRYECGKSNVAYSNFTDSPVSVTVEFVAEEGSICNQRVIYDKWVVDGPIYKAVGAQNELLTDGFIHTSINGQKHYIATFTVPEKGYLIFNPSGTIKSPSDNGASNSGYYKYAISENIIYPKNKVKLPFGGTVYLYPQQSE